MAVLLTYYYPHFLALVFLAVLFSSKIPAKGRFFLRVALVLAIATVLAHVNRWFDLWPAHLYFASGHMTFSFGVALSLGLLRPWTLAITLPLLIPFGIALVVLHFHDVVDVLGAIPLVLIVYGIVDRFWTMSPARVSI
jgi:hypothetical protein